MIFFEYYLSDNVFLNNITFYLYNYDILRNRKRKYQDIYYN